MQDQPAESDKAVTLFLSYARADSAVAQRLASALEHAGFTLWWDAMIAGGEAYSRSIADALEKADWSSSYGRKARSNPTGSRTKPGMAAIDIA